MFEIELHVRSEQWVKNKPNRISYVTDFEQKIILGQLLNSCPFNNKRGLNDSLP